MEVGALRLLELAALIFSVLTGLLTTSLIVFKGGALVQLIDSHERRITVIEARGSPPMSEHVKLDDERELRTRSDVKRMEDVVSRFADVGAKVDALGYKLDITNKTLESMQQRKVQP